MCVRVEIVGDTTTLSLRKLQLESSTAALWGFMCVCVGVCGGAGGRRGTSAAPGCPGLFWH